MLDPMPPQIMEDEIMSAQDIVEHLDEMKIGLDDTFRFHCTKCGKCCVDREDIILPPRDIYRISKELHMEPLEFYQKYCESYIGNTSRLPIVRLKPVGNAKRCPLLHKRKCIVHHAKPSVCALYPLGRFMELKKEDIYAGHMDPEVKYLLQPVDCGDNSEEHTVREWLGDFNISLEDQVFIQWNQLIAETGTKIKQAEKMVNPFLMRKVWSTLLALMYLNYDTEREFLPQFEKNAAEVKELLSVIPVEEDS